MKKLRPTLIATTIALTALPLFSLAATQPAGSTPATSGQGCNLQASLDKLGTIKNQEGKEDVEFDIYHEVLTNVLVCSLSEIASFRDKLGALENLNETDTNIQGAFIKDLEGYALYYKKIAGQLEKIKTVEDQKQLAGEILNWRKENYSDRAKIIANFIFIFRGREAIEITGMRIKKISIALQGTGLLFRKENWKDFNALLNEAQSHIANAQKLNTEAYNLFKNELNPSELIEATKEETAKISITDLLRASLLEIRESYLNFSEIGKLVTKVSP